MAVAARREGLAATFVMCWRRQSINLAIGRPSKQKSCTTYLLRLRTRRTTRRNGVRVYSRLASAPAESPGALRRGSRTVSRGVHGVGDWHLFPVGGLEIATVFEYLSATRTTW